MTKPNDVIGGGGHRSRLLVRLGDVALPNGANVSALNLGIDEIYVTDASGTVTMVTRNATPQIVNVLAYQGGVTTPIADASVPTTTYSSLTVVVDTASSNVVFGSVSPRTKRAGTIGTSTSSSAPRPLSFQNKATLSSARFGALTTTSQYSSSTVAITFHRAITTVTNEEEDIDIDFNAFESIWPSDVVVPSRPSLTVATEGFEGMISGTVHNTSHSPVQQAVVVAFDSSGNPAASAFTDAYGNFLMHTLGVGSYRLTVYNKYVTATGWSIVARGYTRSTASFAGPSSVYVNAGQTHNVGIITD